MKWFNGGITEAITFSKLKSAIFVVYIEGKNADSNKFTDIINASEITRILESDKFVAIKIEGDSLPHQQFSEIYQNTVVPSLYFIGKNGQPLDIITEAHDVPSTIKKIDKVLIKGLGVSPNQAETSSSFLRSEQNSTMPANVVCENGVCTIQKPNVSPEDKLARAKELVDKQNKVKAAEEKEKERQRELERRKMGQDVQQMKRWQEDQELKQLKEEREREKRENQAARDRVLAQIAQDKAERASKFASPTTSTTPTTNSPSEPKPAVQSNIARLQFKLPDGSAHTQDFPSSETLQAVRSYITQNLNLTCTSYTLSTMFPRREFTEDDNNKSMMDLQLTPNAVILILPLNRGTVQTNQPSGVGGLIWSLLSPIFGILGFIKTFIFGSSNTSSNDQGSSSTYSSNRGSNTVLHVRNKYDLNSKLSSAGSKLVVIDFFATWCGPCKMIAPRLEEMAREFRNVVFLKVDVDDNRDIASDYKVSAMPTFVFIKNKRVLTSFSGADYYKIRDTITRYKHDNSHGPTKPATGIRRRGHGGNIHRLTDMNDSDDDTNTWNGNSTQQM